MFVRLIILCLPMLAFSQTCKVYHHTYKFSHLTAEEASLRDEINQIYRLEENALDSAQFRKEATSDSIERVYDRLDKAEEALGRVRLHLKRAQKLAHDPTACCHALMCAAVQIQYARLQIEDGHYHKAVDQNLMAFETGQTKTKVDPY